MTEDYPGIPYGYENVLPISQRYQQNPYAMSMTGTEGTRYIPYKILFVLMVKNWVKSFEISNLVFRESV